MENQDHDNDYYMWKSSPPKSPTYTTEEIQKFRVERIKRIMDNYKCSQERALTFIDLREEGHGVYQASVMAGIADPTF